MLLSNGQRLRLLGLAAAAEAEDVEHGSWIQDLREKAVLCQRIPEKGSRAERVLSRS